MRFSGQTIPTAAVSRLGCSTLRCVSRRPQFAQLLSTLSASHPKVFSPVARHAVPPNASFSPTHAHSRCPFSNVSIDVKFNNFIASKRKTYASGVFWAGIEMCGSLHCCKAPALFPPSNSPLLLRLIQLCDRSASVATLSQLFHSPSQSARIPHVSP